MVSYTACFLVHHTWYPKTLLPVYRYIYSSLSVWKESEKGKWKKWVSSLFHPSPVCFALQPRSPGRERCVEWERAATHVKPHCLTFTGSAKNVDLWCVWTVTRPRRGKAPKVSCHFHIHLWTLTLLVHSFWWLKNGKTVKMPQTYEWGTFFVIYIYIDSTKIYIYIYIYIYIFFFFFFCIIIKKKL